MILNTINENPKDDLNKKYLLELCYSLLEISKQYGLNNELTNKIKLLEH